MDYEQKYKEALERAKESMNNASLSKGTLRVLDIIFPELKESEDERIRKSLIDMLKNDEKCYLKEIAWLEKQVPVDKDKVVKGVRQGVALSIMNYLNRNTLGMCLSSIECADLESAVVDSDWSKVYDYMKMKLEKQVEAKFKIEDWICNGGGNPCKVNDIFGNYYDLCSIEGYEYNKPISDIDANYHLWSINDAKDGDVLVHNDVVFIFTGIENGIVTGFEENFVCGEIPACFGEAYKYNDYHPANKIERDILFQNMKEACYEWDAKKKELKKTEQNQNLAWSEEDECYMTECINAIATKDSWSFEEKRKTKHWLKSLKDRYTWKQSDGQMNNL